MEYVSWWWQRDACSLLPSVHVFCLFSWLLYGQSFRAKYRLYWGPRLMQIEQVKLFRGVAFAPTSSSQEIRTIFPRVAGVCLNSVCTVQWAPLRCSLLARTRPCARVIIHPARATRIGGMDVAWSPTSVCCWLWFVQIAAQWMFTWCRQKNKQIM